MAAIVDMDSEAPPAGESWMSDMIDFEAPPETQDLAVYGAFIHKQILT